MNLYEITDMNTGKVIEPAITLKEASERLNCKSYLISNAYHGGHLAKRRYRVGLADETVKKMDPIWIDWELCRNRILKYGRR